MDLTIESAGLYLVGMRTCYLGLIALTNRNWSFYLESLKFQAPCPGFGPEISFNPKKTMSVWCGLNCRIEILNDSTRPAWIRAIH